MRPDGRARSPRRPSHEPAASLAPKWAVKLTFDTTVGTVTGLRDGHPGAPAALVLAHGAGAGMTSAFMEIMAAHLAETLLVYRFNFPFADRGARRPDRLGVAEEAWLGVLHQVRSATSAPLFAGGKSFGGRMASHVVAGGESVAGLVLLGYPLHPPGRPERVRAGHLGAITCPMLFVEGTRDPLCPLGALQPVLAGLPGPTRLAVIEDGDHSFKVPKRSGRTTEQAWTQAASEVAAWVTEILA